MPAAKKILFLSTTAASGNGSAVWGGEAFAKEFLAQISKRGWKVTLVCPPSSPLLKDPGLLDSLDRHIALDVSGGVRQPLKFLRVLCEWLAIIRANRDYLYYGNAFQSLKWLALGALVFKIRTVCHLHESSYEHYQSPRTRFLARFIRAFIAISDSVKDFFVRGSGVSPGKVTVVHNGIEVQAVVELSRSRREALLETFGVPAAGRLVMMAARTDPLKGHEVFFRAAHQVLKSRSDVHFLVAGFEPGQGSQQRLHGDLVTLLHTLGVVKKFTTIGYTDKVRMLMRCSDIVVVPSISEGFGRTAIEAMAEGAALIASRVGGLQEIVRHGVDGLLFENRNPDDLSEKILALLDDEETRRNMAKRGHLAALERFSIATMTDKIGNILEMVAVG